MKDKISIVKKAGYGMISSVIGGIPVMLIMNRAGMFEKLANYLGFRMNVPIGIMIHFLISIGYGVLYAGLMVVMKSFWKAGLSNLSRTLWGGFIWSIATWIVAIMVMPMVMSNEAFFLGFDLSKILTKHYLTAISISLIGHTVYGLITGVSYYLLAAYFTPNRHDNEFLN